MRALARGLFALLALPAAAQRTWVVDAANGAGADFVSLAVALADARIADGDVLLVRAGVYDPIATAKGVRILGQGGVTIAVAAPQTATSAVTVQTVPAGRTFTLSNVRVEHDCGSSRGAILVQQPVGAVHFEDVHTQGIGYPTWLQPQCQSVSINRAALFTWNRGTVRGGGGIHVNSSTVVLNALAADGLDGTDLGIRIIPCTPALRAWSSTVLLAQTDLRGGGGGGNSGPCPGMLTALVSGASEVRLAGTSANVVAAGVSLFGPATPAIRLDDATLVYDPAVRLVGSQGGSTIDGNGTVGARSLAFPSAAGAPLGGTVQTAVFSPPGEAVFFALSVPTPGQATPLGALFLDLGAMVPLFVGLQNGAGMTALPIPVPAANHLRGLALVVQAAHADSLRNEVVLSPPVVFSLR